jgi:hypothetical protein
VNDFETIRRPQGSTRLNRIKILLTLGLTAMGQNGKTQSSEASEDVGYAINVKNFISRSKYGNVLSFDLFNAPNSLGPGPFLAYAPNDPVFIMSTLQ